MLHVITDDRIEPAHFGAIAALFAQAIHATVMHYVEDGPAGLWNEADYPEAVQHVPAAGNLLPSGLLWCERLLGSPAECTSDLASIVTRAAQEEIVLPLGSPRSPLSASSASSAADGTDKDRGLHALLRLHTQTQHVAIRHYHVTSRNGALCLLSVDDKTEDEEEDDNDATKHISKDHIVDGFARCEQDRFGRWHASSDATARAGDEPNADRVLSRETLPLLIVLIGSERDQRGGYPATLAALGDAADIAGVHFTVEFVTPQTLTPQNCVERLAHADGIVLPGGSDMSRVAGQILAARFALESDVPIVGLCLGMQSMATAAARMALNSDDIGLAEVGAETPGRPYKHSFVPIHDNGTMLHHRLGDGLSRMVSGSRLHTILNNDVVSVRYNHRYTLNDELIAPLATLGVNVSAWGEDNRPAGAADAVSNALGYVDAIEAPAHRFFIGMQGHPELSSTVGRPHPLLLAFLRAAAD